MRRIGRMCAFVSASLFGGCACATLTLSWTIEGSLVQAGTGTPLSGEIIDIRLLREGDIIGGGRFEPFLALDPDGGFELPTPVGSSGTCGFLIFAPPPNRALGDPPDEVEITVLKPDGDEVSVRVPVDQESISDIEELQGVEISGRITLGVIVVPE